MTLEVTAPEIAAHHVHSLVRRLHDADYRLPDEIHDDTLALGQAAVPALLEILEDALSKSPVDGWGPAHAAQLLGELRATDAIEPPRIRRPRRGGPGTVVPGCQRDRRRCGRAPVGAPARAERAGPGAQVW